MSSNNTSGKKRKARSGSNNNGGSISIGVDTLLTKRGKSLQVGEEIRVTLVKGPSFNYLSPDPVNPKAPKEQFPLIAKFPESVVKPDFTTHPWNNARLFQQDIPKAQDDSDEENMVSVDKNGMKKRWRARRKEIPKRQWVLQEEEDFLETMMAKRERKKVSRDQLSTRYEGIPESNPSQFVILELAPPTSSSDDHADGNGNGSTSSSSNNIQIITLPSPHATVAFSQPATRKTLSMVEAENAIQDQRGQTTRYMMHAKQRMLNGTGPPVNATKNRLFSKLKKKAAQDDDEDDDDIMGDLTFRNRKGSGRARKELLNTLGDSGIKVDADGVLGGVNDSEFGRGRKFGRFNAEGNNQNDQNKGGGTGQDEDGGAGSGGVAKSGGPTTKTSSDGLAMADDFYQRDVRAEYEELDYDANEQFDDDDVDLGESEVVVEGSGFADDDDDDELDENEFGDDNPAGAEGLATVAGFRLMLAKARGEITPEQAAEAAAAAAGQDKKGDEDDPTNSKRRDGLDTFDRKKKDHNEPVDHLAQIMAAAEKSVQVAQGKQKKSSSLSNTSSNNDMDEKSSNDKDNMLNNDSTNGGATGGDDNISKILSTSKLTGNEVDENGQRLVTLEAIRREIWLHHGTIPMKRLMKIFDIKKRSAKERQSKFREVVKELCTMETDPMGVRMLVLKQHYANMG